MALPEFDNWIVGLFPVNAHQVDIYTPDSIQSCDGQTVISAPLSLHQDLYCERQTLIIFHEKATWNKRKVKVKSKEVPQHAYGGAEGEDV
jgi:hypothetical protein